MVPIAARRPTSGRAPAGDAGFTLAELVVTVGILAVIAGSAYETLTQRPAQTRSTAVAFASFVTQARALAAISGDGDITGGGGATIEISRDGDASIATLYAYRPALGAAHALQPATNVAPLRFGATAITLDVDGAAVQPPFALFFSPSGHASAKAGYTIGVTPPLSSEPVCSAQTGVVLEFGEPPRTQVYAMSCELARLDLDRTAPHE